MGKVPDFLAYCKDTDSTTNISRNLACRLRAMPVITQAGRIVIPARGPISPVVVFCSLQAGAKGKWGLVRCGGNCY